MASKSIILHMGFFNLINCAFTEDLYGPHWAKMLGFCLPYKQQGVPLQLNCPVPN